MSLSILLFRNVCIDEDIYMQVFYNILSNAVKYTFQGEITIIVSSQNNILTTQILDTGIGITEEKQKSIYSMFSNTISADITGIGIGLYLSKQLLNFLQGDLYLSSKYDKGTDILFWIPQENQEKVSDCDIPNKAPKLISYPSDIRGSFEHKAKELIKEDASIGILIVDDNAMCSTVLKRLLLQISNYILFSAYNGRQAVDIYKENRLQIRLILMDLNMPVLNGIESCKEIFLLRQQNNWQYIDIVAVSAQDDYFYMKEANNAGMKAFLRKPVSLHALRSILSELKLL